jgi:hypothetical protein
MAIHTVGIDIAKTVFHLVALDEKGAVLTKKKFSRSKLLVYTANLKADVIGMEACSGAHFLARALVEQGHDVRMMPAEYVRPYVKSNKNDFIDAEAIAEAVLRPTMRFVPVKMAEQLDLQALHTYWLRYARHGTKASRLLSKYYYRFLFASDTQQVPGRPFPTNFRRRRSISNQEFLPATQLGLYAPRFVLRLRIEGLCARGDERYLSSKDEAEKRPVRFVLGLHKASCLQTYTTPLRVAFLSPSHYDKCH